jgi:hypothetical protein
MDGMTCAHFSTPDAECCAAGVNLAQLAGGGKFYQVMRLPCIEITNRRGEVASVCKQFSGPAPEGKQND